MENSQKPPEQTQEQLDEIRKQIELNNEYQNQIKKDIETQMPFISELLQCEIVSNEYIDTKFEASFRQLILSTDQGGRGYKHIRRLRRDGNCFYRAYLFQLFEHYALNMDSNKTQYQKLISIIEKSKDDLVANGGYDLIVIEDFYDVFLEHVQKLAKLPAEYKSATNENKSKGIKNFSEFVHAHLMKVLCNHDEANYIIMYARFMAATYLKTNAILFEDFLGGDIAGFCLREVEQVDVECDHPQIIAITNYLNQGVEINSISQQGAKIDVTRIPEDGFKDNDFTVKVLFVPGHYDALYE